MLIGYEGGVVAWNFQKGVIDKCFEMMLPPGATGGGSFFDNSVRTMYQNARTRHGLTMITGALD
jgi:hypothetical protein